MHNDHLLIEQRLAAALARVRPAIYSQRVPLSVARAPSRSVPIPVSEGVTGTFEPAAVGDNWGPAWGTTWMRFMGRVPQEWGGRAVEAIIDLGFDYQNVTAGFQAEGLVYRPDGSPIKSLNPATAWVPVTLQAAGGEEVEFYIEAASNPIIPFTVHDPTLQGDVLTASADPLYRIRVADLAIFEREVWELVMDLDVLGQLQAELELSDARRWQILAAIDRALDRVDVHDVSGTTLAARAELEGVLSVPARASAHRISAIGHAHIDSAWLWPAREAIRKVARTAANVTQLMEYHPEFRFAMSSAQHFSWLKVNHPDIYGRVVERVRTGQFIPVGGMWVESDTNMPGSEALARQFAVGKRFFIEEFGIDSQEVWLPDSFGYSAALPQLAQLAGARWFLTQKISWNQTNKFPHHTFYWEGLDGTRLFTHFPPIDTYNSALTATELAHAARNFSEKASGTGSLAPFGYGDGGGGPTREMLARAERLRDLDGSPMVTIEDPSTFFARTEAAYRDAPVWLGELYLEFHRGVYTSQLKTKQGSRRNEHLLREAELWCATASTRSGAKYPYDTLDSIWKKVLLLHFHDILSGSSIAWVHREAAEDHAALARELEALIAAAQRNLTGDGDTPILFNATPHTLEGTPSLGASQASCDEPPRALAVNDGGVYAFDSERLHVEVDGRGLITSIFDRDHDREVLAPKTLGNLLQVHNDTPNFYDAWNVDAFYRNAVTDLIQADSVEVVNGVVHVVRHYGKSTIRQVISVPAAGKRVDIETEVDWAEDEKFLKAGFDLDVNAERSAAEIQFGHVYRPTHTNTSWDAARFEICAHRWIHVGEPGFGVAIVNDSTYGHDVTRHPRTGGGTSTMVRLSLLRAPKNPDPYTDQGHHSLRYSLVPGADVADAIREGYRINLPRRIVQGSSDVQPLVITTNPGVVIESVKLAEDRSGDVVVRLYEALGRTTKVGVLAGFDYSAVHSVDLLERILAPMETTEDGILLSCRPFQIHTLRFAIRA
jgi:alpha-mannosidase